MVGCGGETIKRAHAALLTQWASAMMPSRTSGGTRMHPQTAQAGQDRFDFILRVRDLLLEVLRNAWDSDRRGSPAPLDPDAFTVTRPPRPEMGDLAFPCFPAAKRLGRKPNEIAATLADRAPAALDAAAQSGSIPRIEGVRAVGPYLNLFLHSGSLARTITRQIASAEPPYGAPLPDTGRTTMVEYSAPNTNKPLHVGHVRNNLLGLSLCNLLAAAGETVLPVNLVNDRGIHIAKSMVAYQKWGGGITPQRSGQKGDALVGSFYVRFENALREEKRRLARDQGIAPDQIDASTERRLEEVSPLMAEARDCLRRWEQRDPETRALWETMNGWVYEGFDRTYRRLGCRFRKWYFESETYGLGKQLVEQGLEKGVFQRADDGSAWARLEAFGLKDKILLRSDGTSVYITQDLGTAVLKFDDFGMDRSIYVVASEQVLHFKMLFALLTQLEMPWAAQCHHLSYGLVTLPHGMGKLKSREGRAVDADDLLDELAAVARRKALAGGYVDPSAVELDALADAIGQGALKMYLLQVGAEKNIQFDPDATIDFEGDTGPAVQYSHARICSIVRKGIAAGQLATEDLLLAPLPDPFAGLGTGAPLPEKGSMPDRGQLADDSPRGPAAVRIAVGLRGGVDAAEQLGAPEEKALCIELARFPSVLRLAAGQLSPAPIAGYLLDLTKAYARFYHNCPVLRAETEERMRARVHLCLTTAATLRRGLALLGIAAPDAM
ncbi:MAG: arginine--tRNA ligase [Candidatus Eisenbacteria bacterium]|nr:arginine--tRNA ligase [Candidatus Eisenbacteria bacterium]